MTSYPEALKMILQNVHTLEIQEKPAGECLGQVLAEDVFSDYDLPQADSAGPDGYALKSSDIRDAAKDNPVTLRIIETVRAGHLPRKPITAGATVRIMTGSVMPEGADCVVRFEDTDEPADKNGPNKSNPDEVKIYVSQEPGSNINRAGGSIAKGSLVLSKGKVIGPAQLSVLILIGKSSIKVFRRPVVAVLSTGDELINSGGPLSPGKVYDCNGPAAAALVDHYGGISQKLGIARDSEESLLSRIRSATEADALIISGGVSKGDYDLVRLVTARLGEVKFSRIRVVPGASFAFGMITRPTCNGLLAIPVFALAGPPSGCLTNFETLVRPALLKMLGYTALEHPFVEAIVPGDIPEKKMMFVKWTRVAKINGAYHVELDNIPMGQANSITLIPEGTQVQAGEKIEVLPLDWCRDYRDSLFANGHSNEYKTGQKKTRGR